MHFDEAKSWSIISPKPVIFNEYMCFWMGLFMHKSMAMSIAGHLFMRVPISPPEKRSLWEITFDMIKVAKKMGYEPEFDIKNYEPNDLMRYIASRIGKYKKTTLKDWTEDPKQSFLFFLENQ